MKKLKLNIADIIIFLMRAIFFICFPAIFSTAFAGVKYICQQIGAHSQLQLNSFVVTGVAIMLFTIVFGRFFCGFACSFGIYSDIIYYISCKVRKKIKKRPHSIPKQVGDMFKYIKYIVLISMMYICFKQETAVITANSPWSVFSQLQAFKAPQLGVGMMLFVLITIGMYFERRFFCRFICPMGAIFSLLPVLPISAVKRNRENCINNCHACRMKCPANIEIASIAEGDNQNMGECFSCGKCSAICPKGNVQIGPVKDKNQVILWHILRGVILITLSYFLTHCII